MESKIDERKLIVDFAKDHNDIEALQFIRSDPDGVNIHLILGQGLVNYVYRVSSVDDEKSVIIKHSKEYCRRIPEMKLDLKRQTVEYNALCIMNEILPDSVPHPYCLDTNYNILAMEDMKSWELLGFQLERNHVDLQVASNLGQLLGQAHYKTSRNNVSQERWDELKGKLSGPEFKDFVLQFMTDKAFSQDESVFNLPKELAETSCRYAKQLKEAGIIEHFAKIFVRETCFIHPDCHYKAVFTKDGKTVLFDWEGSFLGAPAHCISRPVGCYILVYIINQYQDEPLPSELTTDEFKTACLKANRTFLDAYLASELDISRTEEAKRQFISELTVLTGLFLWITLRFKAAEEVIRGLNNHSQGALLDLAFKIMMSYDNTHTIDEFISLTS